LPSRSASKNLSGAGIARGRGLAIDAVEVRIQFGGGLTKVLALYSLLAMTFTSAGLRAQTSPSAPQPGNSQSQTQPASPAQQGEAKSQAPSHTNPPAKPPPIPSAGDPFFAPIAISPEKQSLRQRFKDYAVVTFGPRALVNPAISAALLMARPPREYPHYWRDGAGAFGRNYGGDLARAASLQAGRFFTAAFLNEDFRYRPSASHNFLLRGAHAVRFTFVDKSASGQNRFALANFAGAAAGGFVGQLYLPRPYNDLSHAEVRAALVFGTLAGQNLLREFAPDINVVTRKLHLPFPRIPIPAWWTTRKN